MGFSKMFYAFVPVLALLFTVVWNSCISANQSFHKVNTSISQNIDSLQTRIQHIENELFTDQQSREKYLDIRSDIFALNSLIDSVATLLSQEGLHHRDHKFGDSILISKRNGHQLLIKSLEVNDLLQSNLVCESALQGSFSVSPKMEKNHPTKNEWVQENLGHLPVAASVTILNSWKSDNLRTLLRIQEAFLADKCR